MLTEAEIEHFETRGYLVVEDVLDGFRWSIDLRYHVTGEPSGRSWFSEFVARSRARPETELRDWRRWRQMWEEAREHCAAGPHRPIHRWTSDSPFCA